MQRRGAKLWGVGLLVALATVSEGRADPRVRQYPLGDQRTLHIDVPMAPKSVCSFLFPSTIDTVALGDTKKFKVDVVNQQIVTLKSVETLPGDRTTLQVAFQGDRFITADITIVDGPEVVSEVRFDTPPTRAASAAREALNHIAPHGPSQEELERKEMKEIAARHSAAEIDGGAEANGIEVNLLESIQHGPSKQLLRFSIKNDSATPYRIGAAEILHRREGGFLWLRTVEERRIDSELFCESDDLELAPKKRMNCVVGFSKPMKSAHWHVGLRLRESASRPRNINVARILEVYGD